MLRLAAGLHTALLSVDVMGVLLGARCRAGGLLRLRHVTDGLATCFNIHCLLTPRLRKGSRLLAGLPHLHHLVRRRYRSRLGCKRG